MTKKEFVEALKRVIVCNSNLEADEDDEIIFNNTKSVNVIDDDMIIVNLSDEAFAIKVKSI